MKAALLALSLFSVSALARGPTVAVLYFDYDGENTALKGLRKGLAQMLVTDLAGGAAEIVERQQLEQVLSELKLSSTGKLSPASAPKVGKLLGASHLVLGGLFEMAGQVRIDARVVETETGRVVKGVSAYGKPENFHELEAKLSAELNAILAGLPQRAEAGKEAPGPASATAVAVKKRGPAPKAGDAGTESKVSSPRGMTIEVAAAFGRGLDAMDRGEVAIARAELSAVVKQRPDFQLAVDALNGLPN